MQNETLTELFCGLPFNDLPRCQEDPGHKASAVDRINVSFIFSRKQGWIFKMVQLQLSVWAEGNSPIHRRRQAFKAD